MIYDNYHDYLGKIIFLTSIFVFILLLFNPLNNLIFTVDEYFTLGLIKLPLMQGISVTASDVHPPFYYILLKVFSKVFSNLDILFLSKIITIIPYLIILAISCTKIKNEYNWLTAGLFTFSLYAMTEFLRTYYSIRNYSWAILFLVLSFIYLKDVISKSDFKSWGIFTIFTLLGAYTHYFCAISSIGIYLILFGYYLTKWNCLKYEFKKWIFSCIVLILGYAPWLSILFNQLNHVHNGYWITQIDFDKFIQCISCFSTTTSNNYIIILSLIFLIVVLSISIVKIINDESIENVYTLMGLLVFISTLFLGIIISYIFKPILIYKYLLPSTAVFWFAVSILIGKLENKKVFTVILAVIFILGIFGIFGSISNFQEDYQTGIQNQNCLNEINNNNSTIICIGPGVVIQWGTYLNNSNVYMFNMNEAYGVSKKDLKKVFDIEFTSNLNKTVNENKDTEIYVIMGDCNECELINGSNPIYKIARNSIYRYN